MEDGKLDALLEIVRFIEDAPNMGLRERGAFLVYKISLILETLKIGVFSILKLRKICSIRRPKSQNDSTYQSEVLKPLYRAFTFCSVGVWCDHDTMA